LSVELVLDPSSVSETVDYLEQARERILQAIRDSMLEAMGGLSDAAVAEMTDVGIKQRTGEFTLELLSSPKVSETKDIIRGTVSTDVGAKHVGLWLEEGIHDPDVPGHLFEFTEPDGDSAFTLGHKAFDVKPHPFLNPALEHYASTIEEIISDAVDEAIEV
jgi:hypothetical protein